MRRVLLILALVAAVVLCLGWIVHEPYDDMKLFSALPADTTLVTFHQDLGDRADLIATNPLTRAVLMAASGNKPKMNFFGLKKGPTDLPGKLQELLGLSKRDGTAIEEILQVYAPNRTAVGLVPGASDEKPTVVLATHIGAKMHTLRSLAGFRFDSTETHRELNIYDWGNNIHLAMSEGMILACLADSPQRSRHGLHRMIDGLTGQADNLAQHQTERMAALVESGVADSAVWSVEGIGDCTLRVTELSRNHLQTEVRVPQAPSEPASLDPVCAELGKLYGNLPMAITVFQPGHGTKIINALPSISVPDWVLDLKQPASMAVIGGEYGSKFFGMPSAVMTVETVSTVEGQALFDRVIAESGEHVKQINTETNGRAYVELETIINRGVGPMAYPDRIACHITPHRLYLGSSTKVLDKLLARLGSREAAFEADTGRWYRAYKEDPGTGFAWVDSDKLGGKTSVALAAAGVAFMRDAKKKELIERAKVLVDGLKDMKRVTVVENVEGESLMIRVSSGP